MTPLHGRLEDGKWMYVQLDGQFYVGRERKFKFHHTSLSGGQEVESAGTFTIKNTALSKLSLVSGHYRPQIKHGRQCLHCLREKSMDVSQLEITYCLVKGDHVSRRRMLVEDFLNLDSDENAQTSEPFFVPLQDLAKISAGKGELLMTTAGSFWVGSPKLAEDDHLCAAAAPFLLAASIKLRAGQITHVIFNTCLDAPGDLAKMKVFVHTLLDQGIDLEGVNFRLIDKHEKIVVTYHDILALSSEL